MELAGRVALVTGGAHRVGRAIALELAAAGAAVAVAYHRSEDQAAETVTELRDCGVDAGAFKADLAVPAEAAGLAEAVAGRLGPIDALVNSASWFARDEFPSDDTDTWYRTLDVVLHGPFHLTNAVAPSMLERGGGAIVNIVDLSAWQPWPGRAAHSVAKAALLALTRQVAVELAPTVRCNAVALGPTIAPAKFGPDQVERLRQRTLLGRWSGGPEAGRAVRYLLEAEAVTGECLTVDGGEQYGHVRDRFTDTAG
ncbi:MAG: SDR family oxidoreductase [Acidimicrobiaceae bacterium]|nr:SDR family oxidoreductase [Acidimicrobiaceae bacterium]MYF43886.1 SDR family oxidoreductase [Acidimicrobiaceae bacterium]MYJ36621.1 SDR family oxidoreductase [Acidimicrobiaceae bacterium]